MKISLRQILASVTGAVLAALIASVFGVAGTIIGVAIGSAVATVGTAVALQSFERTHEVGAPGRRARRRARTRARPGAGGHRPRRPRSGARARSRRPSGPPTGAPSPPPPRSGRRGRGRPVGVRTVALVSALVFVVSLLVITVVELAAGHPLSDLFGGASGSDPSIAQLVMPGSTTSPSTTTTPTTVPTTTPSSTTTTPPATSPTTTPPSPTTTTTTTTAAATTTTTVPAPGGAASPGALSAVGGRLDRAPLGNLDRMSSAEELRAQADAMLWFHSIDLGLGVTTRGLSELALPAEQLPDVRRAHACSTSVPGTAYYSFFAEQHGAHAGRSPRPLRLGRRLRRPPGLLGGVLPSRVSCRTTTAT